MTNPSIWTPGQAVSAESSNRVQTFIAAVGQTNFTITNFTYEVGTNSLEVDVSGVNQRPGIDFIETGSNSFSLTSPIEEVGTSVFVRGLVDVHGNPQVISDASNVSYRTETVRTALDARLPELANYAALDAYDGDLLAGVYVRGVSNIFDGGHGVFRPTTDTPSTANGIYRQDAVGRWWKREYTQGNLHADWFGADKSGVASSTAAIAAAFSVLLPLGGNVSLSSGVYKANVSIPSGCSLTGRSNTGILTADPKGTRIVADDLAAPIVKINNGSTAVRAAAIKNVCIDAAGAQTGLYIAGASYINIDTVSVINSAHTNILIECLASNPTFFIFLRSVTTYNGASYNFRVLENPNAGGVTFTTGIYCTNFVSFTQPGKTTEGRIAYIQGQVIAHGYWEDTGTNLIVIDKSASLDTMLIGNGLTIDGATGSSTVKVITSPTWSATKSVSLNSYYVPTTANGNYYRCTTAGTTGTTEPTWPTTIGATVTDGTAVWTCSTYSGSRLNSYLYGQISIDGNVTNGSSGDVTTGPVGSLQTDYSIPGIIRTSYLAPKIVGTATALQYSWYDSTAKAMRRSTLQPASATSGNVIVGAEAGFSAAPTTGTWTKGDVVFNAATGRGLVIGWVCTAAGTPGTWESFGSAGAVENVAALPPADSSQRGRMITVLAGSGTADKLYICLRSTAGAYSWVQVAAG